MRYVTWFCLVFCFSVLCFLMDEAYPQECLMDDGSPANWYGADPYINTSNQGQFIYVQANPDGEYPAMGSGAPGVYLVRKNQDPNNSGWSCFENMPGDLGVTTWYTESENCRYRSRIRRPAEGSCPEGWWGGTTMEEMVWYVVGSGCAYGTTQPDPSTNDLDGDGVVDNQDCFANDNTVGIGQPSSNPMTDDGVQTYFNLEKVFDANGNLIYQKSMGFDADGNITGIYEFGDPTAAGQILAGNMEGTVISNTYYEGVQDDPLNDNVHDVTDLEDDLQTDINGGTQETGIPFTPDTSTNTSTPPGDQATPTPDPGADTTTETLDYSDQFGAIIENQGKQMTNQNNERQLSENRNSLLSDIKNKLDNLGGGTTVLPGEGYDGPSADEIGQAVDSHLSDTTGMGEVDKTSSEMDQAETSATTAFSTENTLTNDAPEDYREKRDIGTKVDEIDSNSTVLGIKSLFTNSQIIASGDPCLNWNYKGEQIDLCVDQYQSQLQTWGAVIMSLVGLHCFLIVFRRR